MDELGQVSAVLEKLGHTAHTHTSAQSACTETEICLKPGDGFDAVVSVPSRGAAYIVDPMTAWGLLDGLEPGATLDAICGELASIDHTF